MMTTQKVVDGRGTVKVPHKKTMRGKGMDKIVADFIWCKNIMKKQARSECETIVYHKERNSWTIGGCSAVLNPAWWLLLAGETLLQNINKKFYNGEIYRSLNKQITTWKLCILFDMEKCKIKTSRLNQGNHFIHSFHSCASTSYCSRPKAIELNKQKSYHSCTSIH